MPNKHTPSSRSVLVAVPIVFLLVSVAATWPIATDPAHLSVVPPSDNDFRLNIYLIFWGAHSLSNDPFGIHHTNMFYPERYTFAYADMLLAHSVLMLPVIQAFANPVLTYNLFLLASLTIGASGFFFLCRQVTGENRVALLGALLWAFNPVHFTRYQQIQLVGDHWLPWLAWALWRWLAPVDDRAARAASPAWAGLAAVFFCLNALSGSHIAVYGAVLVMLAAAFALPRRRPWRDRRVAVALSVFAVITFAVLAPLFWPYALLENEMADRRAETLDLPNASLRPYELFSARSRFYVGLEERLGWPSSVLNRGGRELSGYAFPGAIPICLAVIGMVAAAPALRRVRNFWSVYLAVFVFLALGTYGAYAVLADVPLFRLIRVPLRFMAPAMLGLALLAALGAKSLADRTDGRAASVAVIVALAALFAVEASFAPLRTWRFDPDRHPITEYLASQPGDFTVVEFPLEPFSYSVNMRQVFNSIYHWKRLVVGYSGWQSDANIELLRRIRDHFPDAEALDELARLEVRYVVVALDRVEPELLERVASQTRLQPALALDDAVLFQLNPRAAPLQ